MFLNLQRTTGLKKDTKEDEGDADVEGEIDFPTLAKDKKSQNNRVARLQVVCEIDGKGRKALQGLNL